MTALAVTSCFCSLGASNTWNHNHLTVKANNTSLSPSEDHLVLFWRFNPFTAMLAMLSLRKRPIKVPNFQLLRLFLPPLLEHVKGFLSKCTVLKVDWLQDCQKICLEACVCTHFSLETLQAGAVKGLKHTATSLYTHTTHFSIKFKLDIICSMQAHNYIHTLNRCVKN